MTHSPIRTCRHTVAVLVMLVILPFCPVIAADALLVDASGNTTATGSLTVQGTTGITATNVTVTRSTQAVGGEAVRGDDPRLVTVALPDTAQTWSTPGTYQWTVPVGVTQVYVYCRGGGGGGGGGGSSGGTATAGGNGETGNEISASFGVTPGSVITVIVGGGGGGGGAAAAGTGRGGGGGGGGGSSSFNTVLIAGGGGGGGGGAVAISGRYGGGGGAGGFAGGQGGGSGGGGGAAGSGGSSLGGLGGAGGAVSGPTAGTSGTLGGRDRGTMKIVPFAPAPDLVPLGAGSRGIAGSVNGSGSAGKDGCVIVVWHAP